MDRLKDEQIYHKYGCRKVPSTWSLEQHPTFCGQDFLDIQDRNSYSSTMQKQCLIKHFSPDKPAGQFNRIDDSQVTCATAEIVFEGLLYFLVIGIRIVVQ